MNIKVFAFALCAFVASVQESANGQNAGSGNSGGAIGFPGNSGSAAGAGNVRRRKRPTCSCSGLESAHIQSLSQVSLAVDIIMEPIIEIYNTAAGNRRESYSIDEAICRSFIIFKWAIITSLNVIVRSQPGVTSIAPFLYSALVHLSQFQNALAITLEQAVLKRPANNLVALVLFLQQRCQEGAIGVITVLFDLMKTVANGNPTLLACIESNRTESEKGVKEMVELFFRALRILLSHVHQVEFTDCEGFTVFSFQNIRSSIKAAFRIERSTFFAPVTDICQTNCED